MNGVGKTLTINPVGTNTSLTLSGLTLTNGIIHTTGASSVIQLPSHRNNLRRRYSFLCRWESWLDSSFNFGDKSYLSAMGSSGIYRPFTLNVSQTAATSTVWTGGVVEPNALTGKTLGTGIDRVSPVRYYTLAESPATAFTGGALTINYGSDDLVSSPTNLRVALDEGGTYTNICSASGGLSPSNRVNYCTRFIIQWKFCTCRCNRGRQFSSF